VLDNRWRENVQMPQRQTHSVEIGTVVRELPLFEVAPGTRIAVLNLLGDSEAVRAAAVELARRLAGVESDALVTAETKSVPLIYQLALELEQPWIVLRKTYRPYMGEALTTETFSITTGAPQRLYLDEKDQALVRGRRVILVDDVISTGSTLEAMRRLMDEAQAEVVAEAAVFTEGEQAREDGVVALGHLPVFRGEGGS
jgi:adenine/guanine phosphoribosyltransferase-like PRPP-binding protein